MPLCCVHVSLLGQTSGNTNCETQDACTARCPRLLLQGSLQVAGFTGQQPPQSAGDYPSWDACAAGLLGLRCVCKWLARMHETHPGAKHQPGGDCSAQEVCALAKATQQMRPTTTNTLPRTHGTMPCRGSVLGLRPRSSIRGLLSLQTVKGSQSRRQTKERVVSMVLLTGHIYGAWREGLAHWGCLVTCGAPGATPRAVSSRKWL